MADPATPEPVIPSSAPPAEIDAVAVRRVWDEILAMVGHKSKKVAAWAREATVRDIDGNTLVLTFRHSFHARALSEQPELISEAAYEVLGTRWQIRCEMAGDQRPISSPPAQNRPAAPAPAAQQAPNGQTPAAQPPAAADEEWPETATLGGAPPAPPAPPTPHAQPAPQARPTPAAEAPTDPRAAARAAASGRGRPAADAEWAGEPPFDPEYDSPAKPAGPPPPEVAAQSVPYEGFDPGDVPTDEVIDEKTARQTSEQQAVQLLQQALGAERIGEVELK